MGRFVFAPLAEADLAQIWDFGAEIWGPDQADRYIRAIVAACTELASGMQPGSPADHIRPGYRSRIIGSHTLFFRRQDAETIVIIRILHQSMDVDRHL